MYPLIVLVITSLKFITPVKVKVWQSCVPVGDSRGEEVLLPSNFSRLFIFLPHSFFSLSSKPAMSYSFKFKFF